MSLLEVFDQLAEALREVRKLHTADPAGYCRECTNPWPCRTFKLCDPRTP